VIRREALYYEIDRLRAENAALRKALAPFAVETPADVGDEMPLSRGRLREWTFGDVKRAREALRATEGE
jgi:hypothetical protein